MIDKDRVIFFNIAWMKNYQGNWETDIPVNGGQWIKEHGWGGEVYNFQPLDGMMYGYVEPGLVEKGGRQRHLNISRLYVKRPFGRDIDSLSGVLVVWVASPKNGDYPEVVGWYENATIFRSAQIPTQKSVRSLPNHKHPGEYFASAREEDCVLIPWQNRTHYLPKKGEAFGHSNIWYAETGGGNTVKENVIKYIQDCKNSHQNITGFYVLGSKYQDDYNKNKWYDMWPKMREKQVVSVGWAAKLDLHEYYGKSESEITRYLGIKNKRESTNTLKLFLNLKPGDLIAVKASGSPKGHTPYLSIRAYAVVIERENKIYEHDPDPNGLGHMINVDIIEEVFIEMPLGGYGRTIQRVTKQEDLKEIFNYYYKTFPTRIGRSSVKRNTEIQYRSGTGDYIAHSTHNKLQQERL